MAESRLVWIDLEMTGLDPDENTIIEIATIVTESDLSIVAEGPSFAIDVGKEELIVDFGIIDICKLIPNYKEILRGKNGR